MKIAFDGQLLLEEKKTGIAWNAHHLILELAKDSENECVIQCFTLCAAPETLDRLRVYQSAGCTVECNRRWKASWYKLLWMMVPIPYRFFFRSETDIAQFFNFTVPPGAKGKKVVFIHDMAYKSCPQTVSRKTRLWLELSMKKSCRHAGHIVTVSAFSKKEISRYLHIPAKDITVVPNAVDHTVFHPGYSEGQIQQVLDKYGVEKEYLLYLGTIEPRKNLERLIGAYSRLLREKKQLPQLVLAGKKGWLCDGIYQSVRNLHLENRILFTGYIEQADSPLLMCGAKVFIFPSLYEGFGMPPLEAMACGTPVIVSNTSALPEVVKDAGIAVDPESEEELSEAVKRLLEDHKYRESLSRLGIERAKKYTWANTAKMLMDVYKNVCRDQPEEGNQMQVLKNDNR